MNAQAGQYDRGPDRSALLDALRVLRERWWLVLVSILVCLAITLGLALASTKQYKATSTLLIKPSNVASLVAPTQAQTQDAARSQGDNLSLVKSGAVAERVKRALHLTDSIDDLRSRVDAAAQPDTNLLSATITDPSPARAAELANAFADQLVGYLRDSDQAQVTQGINAINAQIAQLAPTDVRSRTVLEQALSNATELRAVSSGGANVVDRASVPSSASSPQIKRDGVLGGVVGLVLGIALAFLLDLFDRRVKTVEQFERQYGLPALTSIRYLKERPATSREHHVELEPFRILRDGLGFISLRERIHVALVTSAVPAEGKTRVASGLARAVAVAGRRVALVEVDLHRPTLTRVLGLEPSSEGLTSVLLEEASASSAMLPVPDQPTLSLLPSGPLIHNSAELLRSPAMDALLRELSNEYDFVVLDGPPLLAVSDAQVLIHNPLIDVCLVVGRAFMTTRDDIRTARAVLDRHPGTSIGLVVNGVREIAPGYYYSRGHKDGGSAPRRGFGSFVGARRSE
jgi:capsular exopolysaccharide synthesis family protein